MPVGSCISPPHAQFQIIALAFNSVVKDFAARGRQLHTCSIFRRIHVNGSRAPPECSGKSMSIPPPCGMKHPARQTPEAATVPGLLQRELLKSPRLGWDTRGPTRSPGHRITGQE